MADVTVTHIGGTTFQVEVREGAIRTIHHVTATQTDVQQYGGGRSAERLIKASFEFLLEREPKESIMSAFALPVIERYFPEYPDEIRKRLA
ncbi:MAG: hypothetical protein ACREJU_14985 [Nitrospiraceae bacterium]